MRRVGFVSHPRCGGHDTGPGHPERPARLEAILEHLRRTGCWEVLAHNEPQPATRETLMLVHPTRHIEASERACREGPTALDPDTVVSPRSWPAALAAVGAVTEAIDRVVGGSWASAFCAVRPPGHHALADRAMGFCLFNNVAIGVRYAQRRYGLSRLLIVDWDVHHGNGTQAIFEDDPSVLYFSTHQSPFYPGTGARSEQGRGAGEGFTVNVPLPAGAGDEELLRAFREELRPRAMEFQPQLVLISAGFDAHQDDPLASLAVTEAGYSGLTRVVREIAEACCKGRVVSALEGGYNLVALGRSVEAHLRVLLEEQSTVHSP